jgi:hypothetical protein
VPARQKVPADCQRSVSERWINRTELARDIRLVGLRAHLAHGNWERLSGEAGSRQDRAR